MDENKREFFSTGGRRGSRGKREDRESVRPGERATDGVVLTRTKGFAVSWERIGFSLDGATKTEKSPALTCHRSAIGSPLCYENPTMLVSEFANSGMPDTGCLRVNPLRL